MKKAHAAIARAERRPAKPSWNDREARRQAGAPALARGETTAGEDRERDDHEDEHGADDGRVLLEAPEERGIPNGGIGGKWRQHQERDQEDDRGGEVEDPLDDERPRGLPEADAAIEAAEYPAPKGLAEATRQRVVAGEADERARQADAGTRPNRRAGDDASARRARPTS